MKRKAMENCENNCEKLPKMTRSVIDKDKKYDRQLRLWGDHGQQCLENAKVCIINASALGTEILKNLILPGIGSFTIIDSHKVQQKDLGNNFFLTTDFVGKNRAQATIALLQELNPDVVGNYIDEDTHDILLNKPSLFKEFTVVVACGLHERVLLKLASFLWQENVPLLICQSYGLIGSMRLCTQEHTVMESHPDNAFEDLRLDQPFPSLSIFSNSLDLNTMSKLDHSHTPYVIILLKYLEKWKSGAHDGRLPGNYKEKCMFKDTIKQGLLCNAEGIPEIEDNFEEAIKAVNTSLNTACIPENVQKILNDIKCENITSSSSSFWLLCRALKDFVDENDCLPLRGSIPDMTADSKRFVQLQNIYHEKAMEDVEIFTQKLQRILSSIGKRTDFVAENEIKLFCKNAAFLKVICCTSLEKEYNTIPANIVNQLEDEDNVSVFYVLLRAVEKFHTKFNKYPGEVDEFVESDFERLQSCVLNLLQDWGVNIPIKEEYIREVCRFGGCELHAVSAFLGGAAAQEIIKLITHQYVPFHDHYIYNAIDGTSITLKF